MAQDIIQKIFSSAEGTRQQDRFTEALNPANLELHAFSTADWMKFAWRFAEKINFFDSNNTISGNWQDFFIHEEEVSSLLQSINSKNDLTPHLTLFISFLKLIEISSQHLNQIGQRHLDFYYQDILHIAKKEAVADQLHLLFELAKNSKEELLKAGTEIDAGNDADGKKRVYKLIDDIVVNKASVSQLKNIYHHSSPSLKAVKACSVANSYDGLGADFPENETSWHPFGFADQGISDIPPSLPDARIGFAVASPVLLAKEGKRTVTIQIEFEHALLLKRDITDGLSPIVSGEKEWIEPRSFSAYICYTDENQSTKKAQEDKSITDFLERYQHKKPAVYDSYFERRHHTIQNRRLLELTMVFDRSAKPIVAYNQDKLGERFSTEHPLARILINSNTADGYLLATSLCENSIKTINVRIDVDGIQDIDTENDFGLIKTDKPFYPFGPVPAKGSKFAIRHPESFSKNLLELLLSIHWQSVPESFADYYKNYPTTIDDTYFKVSINQIDNNKVVETETGVPLFVEKKDDTITEKERGITNSETVPGKREISIDSPGLSYSTKLQIKLEQSFLHETYPAIYAQALMKFYNDNTVIIPNEAFTPIIESLELQYSASDTVHFFTGGLNSDNNSVELFHEHPFGQIAVEQQQYTKLIPYYQTGGELYIGIKGAEERQQVSLLFQLAEGSENPLAESYSDTENIQWSILSNNAWKLLDNSLLVRDQTDTMLKSGIVTFTIPADATTCNTILPEGMHWLRLSSSKSFDAVCKIVDIQAQAAIAEFVDQKNNLAHLSTGLAPGSVKALLQKKSAIKQVLQPYVSSGGKDKESDSSYYRRISERLRHKNRAITQWDYERLVLEQFPELYKVRCLNHSSEKSSLSPGDIRLVVIPNINDLNVYDIFQPRVSKAKLNAIEAFINRHNSMHVHAKAVNPEYEEVKITLNVSFHAGYDVNFHAQAMQDDLVKLLSPWAFNKAAGIQFNTQIHKSVLISYIEKLEYVDYITDIQIMHKDRIKESVIPSHPRSILVSAKQHSINTI